jgi:Methyltransferase domain
MGLGERAAVAGVLAELRPAVSIELGTYLGGSLSTISKLSGHVHSFDLELQVDASAYPNATFHVGDSHELLPTVLKELAAGGTDVQFALVDGDHSPDGARRDVLDLLGSNAMRSGVILLHDTGNEAVRRGLEEISYAQYGNVGLIDLDFVPAVSPKGSLSSRWGGLGMILLDEHREGPGAEPTRSANAQDALSAVRELRRQARRAAGLTLRRAGVHPAQLRAKRNAKAPRP